MPESTEAGVMGVIGCGVCGSIPIGSLCDIDPGNSEE